jgi:hypothetical protein
MRRVFVKKARCFFASLRHFWSVMFVREALDSFEQTFVWS